MIDPGTIRENRLDNTTFRHELYPPSAEGVSEIRMSIADVDDGEARFRLVNTIQNLFQKKVVDLTRTNLERGIIADIDASDSPIRGRWLITSRKVGCLFWRILESILYWVKQWFPCFYTPPTGWRVDVTITNIKGHCCEELAARIAGATAILHVPSSEGLPDRARTLPLPQTAEEILRIPNFADPATCLSRLCLQTVEGPYVMEADLQSDYCLLIEGESLSLKRIPSKKDDAYRDANRAVVRYYVTFLKREFGLDFLTQIQQTSGIDLGAMIDSGSPLTPDIVSRCNACANNIEMRHLERLWHRLCIFKSRFSAISTGKDHEFLLLMPTDEVDIRQHILPWRGVRRLLEGRTYEQVTAFLHKLIGDAPPESVQDLSPEKFNAVRGLFESTPEELDRVYTGRKITHIAISGFNTMGNPNKSNPVSCQAELLQIFNGLRHDWNTFVELTAHVYSKKNHFRLTSDQRKEEWHVGAIIPGPMADDKQETSFFTQAVVDDGQGSFSYVLEPACHNYTLNGRRLPWFKVYRSTNSNPNSPGWWTSLLADLNSTGSPGSLNPDAAYVQERAALDRRSLPIWSAYLEAACMIKSDPALSALTHEQALTNAVEELDEYLKMIEPEARVGLMEPLRTALHMKQTEHVEKSLRWIASRYRERPSDKIAQDTFHIGHSLGASNAQLFTWHHFPKQRRIPMIGCGSYTVAFNGTGIDKAHDEEFISFGRQHKELLRLLHVHFSVQHQLEYGDIVPQGGERHLGTTGHTDEDDSWLRVNAYVFKPNIYDAPQTATALPIITLQTHGRRISEAVEGEGQDFVRTPLTPQQLVDFHDSWYLPSDLHRLFGYPLLISPYISEKVRRVVAGVFSPLGQLLSPFLEIEAPVRTHENVTYVEYTGSN